VKLILKFMSISLLTLIISTTSHGAVLNINSGTLVGAMNVDVDGTRYDVEFIEGICADIFDDCNENADFTFSNPTNDGTLINAAMQALLDQVFIDTPQGAFDTNPALTLGCTNAVECNVRTPLFVSGGSGLGIVAAVNKNVIDNGQLQFLDHLTAGGGQRGYNTTNGDPFNPAAEAIVYARWTGAAPVPIPAAIWLFGFGMFGLFGIAPRQPRQ
jgi:hypothetical protein